MKKRIEHFVVLVGSVVWFSMFQPWGAFRDPDAFYHAKMSSLFLKHGFIHTFPWLDLTTLGANYVNQHVLFHILNAPFIATFGMFVGHQISTVVFAAIFLTTFYIVLKHLEINYPWLWVMLLAMIPPFLVRFSLGKATPLAVLWLLLTLLAVMKGRRWLLFIVSALYVLTHGGWPLAYILIGGYAFGEGLFIFFIQEAKGSIRRAFIKQWALHFVALVSGTALGLILHPYRAHLFTFLYTQIISIGVATPFQRVVLGVEWRPYDAVSFLGNFAIVWILALVMLFGFLFARKREVSMRIMRWSVGLGVPVAVLFALTIKSRRFGEYFAPVVILWLAVLAKSVDWKRCLDEVRKLHVALRGVLVALMLVGVGRGLLLAGVYLHEGARPFDRIVPALSVIESRLAPGDRLYHVNWAVFPELFAHADQFKYIAGLDPVFLLRANPKLSDRYTAVMTDDASVDLYAVAHNDFGSSMILAEHALDSDVIRRLDADARFDKIFDDKNFAVYETKAPGESYPRE